MNASDILVERLIAWGVDTVFGLPGDGINGVFEALRQNQERIRFIHVGRHVRIPESALREFIAAGLVPPASTKRSKAA